MGDFVEWSFSQHIYLVGVNKSSEYLKEHGYDPYSDRVALVDIPNMDKLKHAITMLPKPVLKSLYGKTVYISTESGRGLAIPDHESIENMNSGIIIEQDINKYRIMHEIGHIVDSTYQEPQIDLFSIDYSDITQYEERPEGFVTYYSLTNQHENFAEHFSYYVTQPGKFRDMAKNDILIREKYYYLRDFVFEGIEY